MTYLSSTCSQWAVPISINTTLNVKLRLVRYYLTVSFLLRLVLFISLRYQPLALARGTHNLWYSRIDRCIDEIYEYYR